jgi:hypothetical protein
MQNTVEETGAASGTDRRTGWRRIANRSDPVVRSTATRHVKTAQDAFVLSLPLLAQMKRVTAGSSDAVPELFGMVSVC